MKNAFFLVVLLFEGSLNTLSKATIFGKILYITFFPLILLVTIIVNIGFWIFMLIVTISIAITMGLDYLGINEKWFKNKLDKIKKIFIKS